jgi:aryl-alcohol dehydrogenase-like predicted oxidoreductase
MKNGSAWNRREFIAKPVAALAATQLLGGTKLLGETSTLEKTSTKTEFSGQPIHRTLGKTGIRLPIVSMGVMNADVPGLIPRSYEFGVRHFDTAAVYQQGRNETMVGNTIKEMGVRDKVIISTKVRVHGPRRGPGNDAQDDANGAAEIEASFHEIFAGSLKRLQMDYVDILYNHSADSEAEVNSEGTLRAMTSLKKEGKARFLGVSSHQPEMALNLAMKLGVYDVVLVPFNFTVADDRGLLDAIEKAASAGIGIVAMKTQAGGATRPNPKLGRQLTPASQTALLKWVLRHDAVTTAIPGYTTYEQLEQNFSVASNLAYTTEERDFLSDKSTVADAQFCRQCGQCREDCPLGVDIPALMRTHMYAVQYASHALAAAMVASLPAAKGLGACGECSTCLAHCRNAVNIAMKINSLKEIAAIGRMTV